MSETGQHAGDCAVVVGAGSRQGIGGALCARFAREGVHVYAVGRTAEKLEALIAGIRGNGGHATAVAADATRPADVLQQRSAWTHELDLRPFKEEF